MSSLKKLFIRGAIWSIVGYGTSQFLRLVSNLILTRLLLPEFFGLMALVNTLRIGLELFSDIGIGQNVIQSKRGNEISFLNTAWTIQVIRGLFLWLICLIITWPITKFYGEERLLLLFPIVGLTTILDGFKSTKLHTLNRQMAIGRKIAFDIATQVISLVTMIVWAWFSPTIWSLVIGAMVGVLFSTVASHFLITGYSNKFTWEKEAVAELVSFGKWIFVSTALMFLADQIDRLLLGKLLSLEMLGVYTVAITIANIPRELIKALSYQVIFPTFSRQTDLSPGSLQAKIKRQRWPILLGFAVLLALLISFGDLIIDQLYDERYRQATWMMPILGLGVWFSVLFYTTSVIILAIGKPWYLSQSNLARLLTVGIGLPLGFYLVGVFGAIAAVALSDLPSFLVLQHGLRREKLACIAQDFLATIFFLGILAIVLVIRSYLGLGFPLDAIL